MTYHPYQTAFTLIEVLLTLALLGVLASFCAFQSISSFQLANTAIQNNQQVITREAAEGKIFRHIHINPSSTP